MQKHFGFLHPVVFSYIKLYKHDHDHQQHVTCTSCILVLQALDGLRLHVHLVQDVSELKQ